MTNQKVLKVGVKQLLNPTPKALTYTFRALLYLSAVYVVAVQPHLELSNGIEAEINKWLLIGNAVMNVTIKFFGLDFKN